MATAFNSSSTSSSLIFSPRLVKTANPSLASLQSIPWPRAERFRRRRTISQLPHTNEARHVLVKHLKTPTIFFRLARFPESTRSVQNFLEGVEVNCRFRHPVYISAMFPSLVIDRRFLGGKSLQSPPTPFSNSCISASVGFCPHARRRSPRDSRATRPLPRLSNRAKASL